MESSHQPEYSYRQFQELDAYLVRRVEEVRQHVRETGSIEEVDKLNEEFGTFDLLGASMRLSSDLLCVSESKLQEPAGRPIPVFDPDALAHTSYIGEFMGVCVNEGADGPDLWYMLELPFDESTLRYRSVSAPVSEARLEVCQDASALMEADEDDKHKLWDFLDILQRPNDASYQDALRQLIENLEKSTKINVTLLQLLGEYATTLLSYPEVADVPEFRHALCMIFVELLDIDAAATFAGFEVHFDHPANKTEFHVDHQAEFYGRIDHVTLVRDFNYDIHDDGISHLALQQTDQPALVVVDGDDVKHTLPVRYLTNFRFTNIPERCLESRNRFLASNPRLFKSNS